ncbi:pyruvate kinase [Bradyrhizobium zhanjiangense]|uniref:pyruvate kinase n=1 Tax=Bradyrhizobium zhanjiangense TaxID=1325107 RepID=A0ABY0D8Z5_9BRAD|nr:pyruvate kinase [Bradyrhizobium zhanjiangense]RXG85581.1 hypothetical protein EAS62_38745 [Bradyrhizobium zhanjiangense]
MSFARLLSVNREGDEVRRNRNAKIVASLDPATSSPETIRELFLAGVDVFRLNLSHGTHADHAALMACVRATEKEFDRLIAPGRSAGATAANRRIRRRRDRSDERSAVSSRSGPDRGRSPQSLSSSPCAGLESESKLLLDDGKIQLRVTSCGTDFAETEIIAGGKLQDRTEVNVPQGSTAFPRPWREGSARSGFCYVARGPIGGAFVCPARGGMDAVREAVGGRAAVMAKLKSRLRSAI